MQQLTNQVSSKNSFIRRRHKLPIIKNGTETYLTHKEAKIVTLLIRGLRAKQIAWELESSLHTVNTHLANIKDKLNCNNIFQLGLILGSYKVQVDSFTDV